MDIDLTRLRGFHLEARMPVPETSGRAAGVLELVVTWDGNRLLIEGVTTARDALAVLRLLEGRRPGDDDEDPLAFPPPAPPGTAPAGVLAAQDAPTAPAPLPVAPPPAQPPGGSQGAPGGVPPVGGTLPPLDLAPFKLASKLADVLEALRASGVGAAGVGHPAEAYVRACVHLRKIDACPVLARVPRLSERVVGACVRLGLVSFPSEDAADAEVARLTKLYDGG